MSEHSDMLSQNLIHEARHNRDMGATIGRQLSTWMVIANVGGLAFVLNAMKEGKLPGGVPSQLEYGLFLLGTIVSFAGLYVAQLLHLRLFNVFNNAGLAIANSEQREKFVDELGADAKLPDELVEGAAFDDEAFRRLTKPLGNLGWLIYVGFGLSGVALTCLAAGFAIPLFYLSQ